MIHSRILIALAILTVSASLAAQQGPQVPCAGCEELTKAPYPEPGLWYNPDQSGSGFTFEFQNGVMAGYYFGYDAEGRPEWYLITGTLQQSEAPDVMWQVEVEPQRFSGGNCLGCPYQAPDEPEALPALSLEFLQRAYARVTLEDESVQYMVPILYGDGGNAFFADHTPYQFPRMTANPYSSLWTLIFKEPDEAEHDPWTYDAFIMMIREGRHHHSGSHAGNVVYRVSMPLHPPEGSIGFGEIVCGPEEPENEPGCALITPGNEYRIPIANFTDNRFFGEAEDGSTVQGFRLQYD